MPSKPVEKPALLIIDMVKDYFDESKQLPITGPAKNILDPLNRMIDCFHRRSWPVVFATDAFKEGDFIFTGRMKPHSLAGSVGAEVVEALNRTESDLWLPKPRFSAFFRTGLENWLAREKVTLCAVGGIATHICVLTSVLDALSHGFKAILLEDCSAAPSEDIHRRILDCYRRNPLYPLLRVGTADEFAAGFDREV
jgi:nicotinamidase-related amidase